MSNFTWTNFKPFVLFYLVVCILGYSLSPGEQPNINWRLTKPKTEKQTDIEMVYEMWTNKELIQLKKEIAEAEQARVRELLIKKHPEYVAWTEKDWERYEMRQAWEDSIFKYLYDLGKERR